MTDDLDPRFVDRVGEPPRRRLLPRLLTWGGVLLLVLAAGVWLMRLRAAGNATPPPRAVHRNDSALARMVLPTPQAGLLDEPIEAVLQPTASGRATSALYGTVRVASSGGRLRPSFHEGLDIAPVERDRAGRALDRVMAVADGRVAYVNPQAGNSNYGVYVVLIHEDPVGEVFTLYAHLAGIEAGLKAGKKVVAGAVLGRMGNTPSSIVPVSRAHLHFEIGLLANSRFDRWMASRKAANPAGVYHGWNLLGCDPLRLMQEQRRRGKAFTMLKHLASLPIAFEVMIPSGRRPEFFDRYPSLWRGGPFRGTAVVVAASEGGVPLLGREATGEECAQARGTSAVVLAADAGVLGGNGRRIVEKQGERWVLGASGPQWLEVLLY